MFAVGAKTWCARTAPQLAASADGAAPNLCQVLQVVEKALLVGYHPATPQVPWRRVARVQEEARRHPSATGLRVPPGLSPGRLGGRQRAVGAGRWWCGVTHGITSSRHHVTAREEAHTVQVGEEAQAEGACQRPQRHRYCGRHGGAVRGGAFAVGSPARHDWPGPGPTCGAA